MAVQEQYDAARTGLCFSCRKPMQTIIRKSTEKILAAGKSEICQNKNCVLFIDFSKLQNWKLAPELNFRPKTTQNTFSRF